MKKNQKGLSLIEVLVSLMVISVLFLGIFSLINISLKITADNKFYVAAIEIANQKMEQIRNLPYDRVGVQGGMPSGNIPQVETISRGGDFTVNTYITFKNDVYDDNAGVDTIPNDYKIATIRVGWQSRYGQKQITVFSKIIPRTEETDAGYGLLKIFVNDVNANPVANASVRVVNSALVPAVDVTNPTDNQGILYLPVLESLGNNYEITVTKAGYGTDRTYDPSTSKAPYHLSVTKGDKTEAGFVIDKLAHLQIKTVSANLPQNWQVNTDTSGEAQANSRLTIDNAGFIYIVWQDERGGGSGKAKIYAQKYDSNSNAQWPNPGAPVDQNISTANNTVIPDILVDSAGNLYISWHDDSIGNKEAYLVKRDSADGSDLWGAEKKINTLADSNNQSNPRIALSENFGNATTTVVWQDDRNGDWDVYMQIFDEGGNKLMLPEVRINSNAISDGADQYDPVVAINSADEIFVAWTDNRNGNYDIYTAKFNMNGNVIWADKLINTDGGATDQYSPDIAIDSADNIYITWADDRDGDSNIYAAKLDAGGATQWIPDNIKINTDSGADTQYSPSIAITSTDILYIVWTDLRNGDKDIYAQKYNSNGVAQWTEDLRVNIDTTLSNQYNPDIIIDPSTDEPYTSWQGDQNGDLDIYATTFESYGAETPVAAVPIIVTGTKTISETPVIYEYDQEHTTDASGQINLTLEWDTGYSLELGAATALNIIFKDPAQPLEILPDETKIWTIYVE